MIKFNVNHKVKVRLTDLGLEELKRQHDEFKKIVPSIGDYTSPKTDKNGFSEWQMHSLMSTFGHMMNIGSEVPFETQILLFPEE